MKKKIIEVKISLYKDGVLWEEKTAYKFKEEKFERLQELFWDFADKNLGNIGKMLK